MDLITYALLKRQIAECEANIKALFVVNITQNSDGAFSADKTFEEIVQVYNEGKYNIVANVASELPVIAHLVAISEYGILFSNSLAMKKNDADLITIGISSNNELEVIAIPIGAAGKSAYQYAVEGGYTDTEANFYADLAAMQGLASALAAI